MWWFIGGLIVALFALCFVVDGRARRRGHRFRDGAEISREARQNRRDIHAWKGAALGNKGEDVSWTWHQRRARGDMRP
ncbi:MAG: hypothetical protein JWO67_2762 [Streptosporangiaceae bacterium]|jgi:hypothetical protein|nr:hypothetical protein [Streptosporangiaceae bacterium]